MTSETSGSDHEATLACSSSNAGMPKVKSPRSRVKPPAIALILLGFWTTGVAVYWFIYLLNIRDHVVNDLQLSATLQKNLPMLFFIGYVAAIVFVIIGSFVIFGGVQMFRVRGYVWAMIASILSLVAALFTLWPLLPIGVWALIVLNHSSVKDEFLQRRT